MKTLCIILVAYKNEADTKACIYSLEKLVTNGISLSVVVVNNDTGHRCFNNDFHSLFPLVVINNHSNNGFAGGVNTGIGYALSKGFAYVLLLNPDTIVDSLLVNELMKGFEENKEIGLVSPKIYFAKGFEYHKSYRKEDLGKIIWYAGGIFDWKNVLGKHRGVDEVDAGQFDAIRESDFATGCCMLFRTSLIKEIGLFDEKYFLYYEDTDISERVKKKGYKIFFMPKAILWHKNAGSTGGSGSILQDYYITRNRLLFGMTYAPLRSKIALIKESLSLLTKGRQWQKIGVKDYFLGKFGKGSFVLS